MSACACMYPGCAKAGRCLASSGGRDDQANPLPVYYDAQDCPPPLPTRVRHRGDKINAQGRVSALCFPTPRAIDMKRATWVMSDEAVTCPKCRALIAARLKTPNAKLSGPNGPQEKQR